MGEEAPRTRGHIVVWRPMSGWDPVAALVASTVALTALHGAPPAAPARG